MLTAQAMNELLETDPTAAGQSPPLQVRAITLSGGGLHVRFNRALDVARLVGAGAGGSAFVPPVAVELLNGNTPVHARLLPDPDGAGLQLIVEGGWPSDGEYELRLRSNANGLVTIQGEWLDGDGDGRPGGDYVGRFTISRNANASASGAVLGEFVARLQSLAADSSPLLDREAQVPAEALSHWQLAIAGVGGLYSLMPTTPTTAPARHFGAASVDPAHIRWQRNASQVRGDAFPALRPAQPWLRRWLAGSDQNHTWPPLRL